VAKRTNQFKRANLDFIQHSDITLVAQAIGLQLDQKRTNPRRAICPFHEDTDPSLNLYHSSSSMEGRDHYHCFVCGAHGDALSLIQNYENLQFWDAAKRLADIQGIELPKSGRSAVDKRSGLNTFSEQIDAASAGGADLATFAKNRGFSPKFISDFGGGVVELRQLIEQAVADRAIDLYAEKAHAMTSLTSTALRCRASSSVSALFSKSAIPNKGSRVSLRDH